MKYLLHNNFSKYKVLLVLILTKNKQLQKKPQKLS